MTRVLHLRSSRNFWGVERQLLGTATPLRDLGFESHFLILYRRLADDPSTHPLVGPLTNQGFRVRTLADPRRFTPQIVERVTVEVRSGS